MAMSQVTNDLFCAVDDDSYIAVEKALLAGADPNGRNEFKQTPLHFAALDSSNPIEYPKTYAVRIISLLLEAGADVNAFDHNGQTALHLATIYNFPLVIYALLDAGADMNAVDRAGSTPLSLARSLKGSREPERILEEKICALEKERAERVAQRIQQEKQVQERFERTLAFLDKIPSRRKYP